MNVVVFGASGGIGRQVVQQGLERGFAITAFVRNPVSIADIVHPNLRVVVGNVFHGPDVEHAIAGQAAVIAALGSRTPRQHDPVASIGLQHIISAMGVHQCRRLLSVSSIGIGDPTEYPWHIRRCVIEGLFKRYALHQYQDVSQMEAFVRGSDLDWTLVRPTTLLDGGRSGRYCASTNSRTGTRLWITKADVADFLLSQLDQPTYWRQAVHVGQDWFCRANRLV